MWHLRWQNRHMYLRLAGFVLLTAVLRPGYAQAQSTSSSSNSTYACNFAKVNDHPGKSNYVPVRSGPGAQFQEIARIHSTSEIYICDESGDWLRIFYSKPGGPCGRTSRNGLDVRKTKG